MTLSISEDSFRRQVLTKTWEEELIFIKFIKNKKQLLQIEEEIYNQNEIKKTKEKTINELKGLIDTIVRKQMQSNKYIEEF